MKLRELRGQVLEGQRQRCTRALAERGETNMKHEYCAVPAHFRPVYIYGARGEKEIKRNRHFV